MKKQLFVLGIIVPSLFFASVSGQSYYVKLSHTVYPVIAYLNSTGYIHIADYQKPYTRSQIRDWLAIATKEMPANKIIQRYLNEFSDRDHHVVSIGNDQYSFTGDADFRWLTRAFKHDKPYHKIDIGGNVRGHIGQTLSYQADISTIIYFGNIDMYSGYKIDPDLAPIKHHDFRETYEGDIGLTQLILSTGWGYISFGVDRFKWGPGESGNLLLDIQTFPLVNLHGVADFGPFRFTQVVGVLDNLYPTNAGVEKIYLADQRKISLHRLDVKLGSRFTFGVSEAVVYNHDYSLSYINPLQPFATSEVYRGDTDNNLAAIDFTVKFFGQSKSYIELLADDVDFMQNWFKDYVNKWALLVGHQWANPLGYNNTLFTAEVIRVEPFVYTHRDTANLYELYGQSIGYDLEPNSLRYYSSVQWFQKQNLWHTFTVSHTLHGDGDRIFGKPIDKKADKEFLVGTYEKRLEITYSLEYEFFENMWLMGGLRLESVKNEKIDNTMSEYGGNSDRYSVVVGLSINY